MREALKRLATGYELALVAAVLSVIPTVPTRLLSLPLGLLALYYVYKGFKMLSEVDEKYSPGKKGVLAILVGTFLAFFSLALTPWLTLLAFIIMIYGLVEYFKGLWELSKLKGGSPIKLGIATAIIAFVLAIATSLIFLNSLITQAYRGVQAYQQYAQELQAQLLPAFLLDQFFAGASLVFMLVGVKGILRNLKG